MGSSTSRTAPKRRLNIAMSERGMPPSRSTNTRRRTLGPSRAISTSNRERDRSRATSPASASIFKVSIVDIARKKKWAPAHRSKPQTPSYYRETGAPHNTFLLLPQEELSPVVVEAEDLLPDEKIPDPVDD